MKTLFHAGAAQRRKLFQSLPATALTVQSLLANPLVPGVSVITIGPAKGHSYYDDANGQMVPVWIDAESLATTMSACKVYANGVRVNSDHGTGVSEAAGRLTAFRIDGDKLRADLALFRTYSDFEHLCEIIATIPDTIGLSIDFDGTAEVRAGKAYPRVTEVASTDIVPSPAANDGGLFSAGPGVTAGGVLDRYLAATGAEKTRLLRAHRTELRAEGRRREEAAQFVARATQLGRRSPLMERWQAATGAERTRIFRAHYSELRAEARRLAA